MATTPVVPDGPVVRLEQGSTIRVPDPENPGKEKDVELADRIEVYELTEAIQALINSGKIVVDENVVVKIEKAYVVYTQLLATDLESMTALSGGPVELVRNPDGTAKRGEPSVASKFNYGNDLDAKREVRQKFEKRVAGPAKTVNKTVEGLVALGYTREEAEALAKAKLPTA